MQLRLRRQSPFLSISVSWLMATAVTACALQVPIQGNTPIAVTGDLPPPPAPPPPPPVVKAPEPPPRVELRDNKIEIREKIQFEYNKAVIREVSFDLMNEIAAVIKKNPHIKKLRIEGHASAEGEDAYNKSLSDRRAHAVLDYLVQRGGVAAEVLVAKGYGEERPIAPNDNEENREKNRRVEFNIIEQDVTQKTVEVDAKTGDEKVVTESQRNIKADDADEPEPTRDLSKRDTTSQKAIVPAAATTTKAPRAAKPAAPIKPSKVAKPASAAKPVKPPTGVKPAKAASQAKPKTGKPATKR